MNSINRNQPEKNREDLRGGDAVSKIREMVDQAKSCFFCTSSRAVGSIGVRPMTVQEVDDEGTLWFLCAGDSHTAAEIVVDPAVRLYFQGSARSDFLYLNGLAAASKDPARIKKYWNPMLKTWFTEGVDDPRIMVISVRPAGGYYWDTKNGNVVAGIKMMIGAAVGTTLDDSIEGEVKV